MFHDRKTKDEMIGSTSDTANAPAAARRAHRRSFIFGHTAITHPEIARDIEVRIDADFERIFGSDVALHRRCADKMDPAGD